MSKKRTRIAVVQKRKKQTKISENPDSFLSQRPVWSFAKADFGNNKWNFQNCQFKEGDILKKLSAFENMTWGEIFQTSGGRTNGTNHHYIPFEKMIKNAQKRAEELKILEFEELFSLRLNGRQRLFGILIDGIFRIVWFDNNHEICESNKKHT
jgi:hypothetical protein